MWFEVFMLHFSIKVIGIEILSHNKGLGVLLPDSNIDHDRFH